MHVKILGPGCAKCQRLYDEAHKAVAASGVQASLEKVEKVDEFIEYGIMMTPAIVIDDQVMSSGRVPSTDEIIGWLRQAATT